MRGPLEVDPEVLADLRLRSQTEHTRPRRNVDEIYAWKQPEDVGALKCRTCETLVGVTEETLERMSICNRMLRARGEQPLDRDRVMFCEDCRDAFKARQAERNRDRNDRIAEEVRALKSSTTPRAEHLTIKALRELGHPAVDELVHELAMRIDEKQSKRKAKADL